MTEIIELTGNWAQLQLLFFGAVFCYAWFMRIALRAITKIL